MEERAIKRLLIILAASIIAIVVIKVMLTKTYSQLNAVTVAKKQAAEAAKSAIQEQATSETVDTPAVSGVPEVLKQEAPVSSGVSELK